MFECKSLSLCLNYKKSWPVGDVYILHDLNAKLALDSSGYALDTGTNKQLSKNAQQKRNEYTHILKSAHECRCMGKTSTV
jgi:hypothetical protein